MRNIRQLSGLVLSFVMTLAVVCQAAIAGEANSEYAQPSFDPKHAGVYSMPNERVDTFSGGLNIVERDIVLPGPNGFDLAFTRWYSSKINLWDALCMTSTHEVTPLGVGWQMHMGRLRDNGTTAKPRYTLELPGGQREPFYANTVLGVPNAGYVSTGSWSLREGDCIGAPGLCEIATSPSGIAYHFPNTLAYQMDPDNSYLYVAAILDPIGNQITVQYDFGCNCNQAYILSVSDTWGRQIQFHYTQTQPGQSVCSLTGTPCDSDQECQDRCSGLNGIYCTHDSQCPTGTCSDNGEDSCRWDSDCDRNCSDNPAVTCTTDQDCGGGRRCVGGTKNNQPCTQASHCPGLCQGGKQNTLGCDHDSDCHGECVGGFDAPNQCDYDSQCRGICTGGSTPGSSCNPGPGNPCGGKCTSGRDHTQNCTSNSACEGVCQGGASAGAYCWNVAACPSKCVGGAYAGQNVTCSADWQCSRGLCSGGMNQGEECDGGYNDCPGRCSNNPIMQCSEPYQCPGGECYTGTCVQGTCSIGSCIQTCQLGVCNPGDCEMGTCTEGVCPPGPSCLPQPMCENPGECLDAQCLPGTSGQRFLDYVTVAWVGGTETYQYNVTRGDSVYPLLRDFETPTGLHTYYDYALKAGEQVHDRELKAITLPTGGTIHYTYADHEFHYPLRASFRSVECTRVVTEKRIGSDRWQFHYPSGQPNDRTTTVTDPANDITEHTYYRYSDTGGVHVWMAGLLERVRVIDGANVLREESHLYQPQLISNDSVNTFAGASEPAQVGRRTQTSTTLHGTNTSRVSYGEYDEYGNPAWKAEFGWDDALYRFTEYEYSGANWTLAQAHIVDKPTLVRTESADGTRKAEIVTAYDTSTGGGNARGNVDYVDEWTGAGYRRTSYRYDANGEKTEQTVSSGPASRTTTIQYSRGTLDRVDSPIRMLFDRTVDPNSSLIMAERNGNNVSTNFGYDGSGRITTIDPPGADPSTIVNYNTPTNISVTRGPSEDEYAYDTLGRLKDHRTRVTPSVSTHRVFDYDSRGDILRKYEASHSSSPTAFTVFDRDALGRPNTATSPDGTVSYTYTADTVTITDSIGSRALTYDAFGRLKSVREGGFTTQYEYNELDQLERVVHPGTAAARNFTWNPAGWLLTENHPESGLTQYHYNGIGDREWKEDADGERENYQYDGEGRLTVIDRPGTDNDVHYYYDGNPVPGHAAGYSNVSGYVSGMTDATGSTLWPERDPNGRLLKVEHKRGSTIFVTELGYDANGNLEEVEYPHVGSAKRARVNYTHNAAGLVESVDLNGNSLVDDVKYGPLLKPTELDYSNGVTVHIPTSEAERNRPTELYTVGATRENADADLELEYDYNDRGLISDIHFNGRHDIYEYESARNFLKSVSYAANSIAFDYDSDGNMTSRYSNNFPGNFTRTHLNNRISGCTYSNSGNLLGCEGHSYTYTTNNRVRTADSQVQYSYDGNDRLRETLVLSENRVLLDLRVEPLGRLSRFAGPVGGELVPETDWIYAMGQVVATLSSAQIAVPVGSSLRLTKDGPDVELDWTTGRACENYVVRRSSNAQFSGQVTHDGLQQSAYTDSGAADPLVDRTNYFYLVESANPTPIRWYVRDHRGSTLLALDEQGEVAASYEYHPFGDIKSSTSSCENPGMLYQGSPRDDRTGLDDLGARHYSSAFDRFLVPDSVWPDLGHPIDWNRYLYTTNDPVNRFDPDGRDSFLFTWAPNVDAVGHSAWGTQLRDVNGKPTGKVETRHLWPRSDVSKSGQAPADYRSEIISEGDLAKFTGGEGHGADGIVRIKGDVVQDARATAVLDAMKTDPTYDAQTNSCSTYTRAAVQALGLPGGSGGTVVIDLIGPFDRTLTNVITPVSVHRAVAGSGNAAVTVIKAVPASKDTNDLVIKP